MARYRLNLEVGPEGSCMAHVAELPGCFAIGATREEAITRAPEAIRRYLHWLRSHGEPLEDGSGEVEVAEELPVSGRFPGTPGDAVARFTSDLGEANDVEVERALRWLEWSRAELQALFADVSFAELDWGPPGQPWTLRFILQHIASAEAWYLRNLEEEASHQLPSTLGAVRSWARVRLPGMTPEERQALRVHDGEEWTVRKVLRRFLEHEREHVGQLREILVQYRSQGGAQGAACDCFQRDMVLRRYGRWRLSLSRQQGYLGWCLVILSRHETDAANLTAAEREELWQVVNEARRALDRLFQPDHFNYAFLGNVVRHVHLHLMPRYQSPREFAGRTFRDDHWGWFAIPSAEDAPADVLAALAAALKTELAS